MEKALKARPGTAALLSFIRAAVLWTCHPGQREGEETVVADLGQSSWRGGQVPGRSCSWTWSLTAQSGQRPERTIHAAFGALVVSEVSAATEVTSSRAPPLQLPGDDS